MVLVKAAEVLRNLLHSHQCPVVLTNINFIIAEVGEAICEVGQENIWAVFGEASANLHGLLRRF